MIVSCSSRPDVICHSSMLASRSSSLVPGPRKISFHGSSESCALALRKRLLRYRRFCRSAKDFSKTVRSDKLCSIGHHAATQVLSSAEERGTARVLSRERIARIFNPEGGQRDQDVETSFQQDSSSIRPTLCCITVDRRSNIPSVHLSSLERVTCVSLGIRTAYKLNDHVLKPRASRSMTM